jgi:hypothetical protein
MNNINRMKTIAAVALLALGAMSCSSELTDSAAPVELIVTNSQTLSVLDINPPVGDTSCAQPGGTINMQVIRKSNTSEADPAFLAVRVTRYRVSYRRTDGGTLVPAPFVRSLDTLIQPGSSSGSNFTILELGAFSLAPFAALQPQNGGRDAETGRPFIRMEVFVEVFGETLAGDNVADSTSFPLEFCYGCGGCR